jgi:hypothetical protein
VGNTRKAGCRHAQEPRAEEGLGRVQGVDGSRVFSTPALLLALAVVALGGDAAASADDEIEVPSSVPSVGKWLDERGPSDPRPYDDALVGHGLLGPEYFSFKNRLWLEAGLSFGGYASANVQWGSEGGPEHAISELLLLGTWEPVRHENSTGRLVVGFAHDQTFGHPTTRAFADAQRLVETPNDLDTDPKLTFTTLGLLHWEHEVHTGPGRGWGVRAGQLYGPSYFGVARYLDDDRRYFMARPLAAAAGAQWVGFNDIGLGVNGIGWKAPFYLSAAVMDGKANRKYPDFSSLADGQLLYLAEVGYERDVDGPDEVAVRLTLSHLDVRDGDGPDRGPGQSVMLSADRRFGNRWALAGRWSRSFERLSADYRGLVSIGGLWLRPFGRANDRLGLGVFVGDPSDAARGAESGGEVFYRLQLTQGVSLMPDLQYWSRSDRGGAGAQTWVWGLRANFEF